MASIFTKIVNGEIPCYKVAETKSCFAFLDINPLSKGHTLVIPKKETDYLFDVEDELYVELMRFAKRVGKAIEKVVPCERIGVTYHWRNTKLTNRITGAVNFKANSFSKDQFSFGLEYAFKEMFMLRGGYVLQFGKGGSDIASTALTGPTAGASVEVGIGKKGSDKKTKLAIDYSYRLTNPFSGVHAVGIRVAL